MLDVENFCPVVMSLPDSTAPATKAITMAAIEPIQKDFIAMSLPKFRPRNDGVKAILKQPQDDATGALKVFFSDTNGWEGYAGERMRKTVKDEADVRPTDKTGFW